MFALVGSNPAQHHNLQHSHTPSSHDMWLQGSKPSRTGPSSNEMQMPPIGTD